MKYWGFEYQGVSLPRAFAELMKTGETKIVRLMEGLKDLRSQRGLTHPFPK